MITRDWPRLGLFVRDPRRQLVEDIKHTIEALRCEEFDGVPPDVFTSNYDYRPWRFKAAEYLQQLLDCPAAINALAPEPVPLSVQAAEMIAAYNKVIGLPGRPTGRRGRPRTGNQVAVALAYAARKARLGRRKAKIAAADIARLWSMKSGEQVQDAYADHRDFVDRELAGVLRLARGLTREEALEAIQADLLDDLANRRASESARKAPRVRRRK